MSESAAQAVVDAIERNSAISLLMPATGPGDAKRTRFLGQTSAGIWIECPPKQQLLAETLQRWGKPVGISFRTGEYLVSFSAAILGYRPRFTLSAAVGDVEAICVGEPVGLRMTQRRAGYRAKVALDAEIRTLAWPIDEKASIDIIPPTPGIICDLRDLSINGVGVILKACKGRSPRVSLDDRIRLEVSAAEKHLVIGTRVRQEPRKLPDGSVRVGLNIEGISKTIEGRRTLAQIAQLVAELQRIEARRRRAG
ncbi:PilZ domain-containing protein [Humisphaera borealis]|uniref:PilZ domain-containing protein n=1 Tax=Humisphaera borealis TaxID=2807512 RepID=A0A7M2X4U4_9BACT|nr:hypothetical protein [Humisphaera borealis]QOV92071.1 hypothetical protein IPV69_12245 [Humisphaera borealis]